MATFTGFILVERCPMCRRRRVLLLEWLVTRDYRKTAVALTCPCCDGTWAGDVAGRPT